MSRAPLGLRGRCPQWRIPGVLPIQELRSLLYDREGQPQALNLGSGYGSCPLDPVSRTAYPAPLRPWPRVARWGQGLRGWNRRLGLAQIFCFGYHRLPRLPAPRQATPPLYHSEHALAGGHAPRLRSAEGAPCSRAEML